MLDINNKHKKCTICKDEYTTIHTEVSPGEIIYVCNTCLEAAKHNFIFICMSCGEVYLRPKKQMIERTGDLELKRAYMLCEDMQIIQGIDMCIQCDPEGILEHVSSHNAAIC
jgi:hypothetical protein